MNDYRLAPVMTSLTTHPPLSHTVIEVVADAENVDPIDLDTPLYEAIDPDALNAVFEPAADSPRPHGSITFEYFGHTVVVTSDGTVTVEDDVIDTDQFL